ncbi:hypothetical protein [Meiothermus sp.]|uniref:hypothetical protein n=1 Tax=Meiothermus sp. TaxID=1955249 RepID=UPI00261C4915|nr:hypothetical protein [Meiothermus sp.]
MKLIDLGEEALEHVVGGICVDLGLGKVCYEDGKWSYRSEFNFGPIELNEKESEAFSGPLRSVSTAFDSVMGIDRPYWDPYGISEREGEKYSGGKAF